MRTTTEQLERRLGKNLEPLYILVGDETLLIEEAGDQIRAAARKAGHSERLVFHVLPGFEWERLTQSAANLSLFATRRIIEIRLPSGKPGAEGGKALTALAARLPQDSIIVMFCPQLDAATLKSAWFSNLERAGVVVTTRAVDLSVWITARMKARGLNPESAAVQLLAERVEGNLLAAAQEIEKLRLLCGPGTITAENIENAVADSARYDVYALADACLAGDAPRAVRVWSGLRAEGIELPIVLWVITRELRALAALSLDLESGKKPEQALSGVWERRRPLLLRALQRLGAQRCENLLRQAARVDRRIKGSLRGGDPWEAILDLILGCVGAIPTFLSTESRI